jgi:ribosome biogenesis GTPase
VTEDRRGRYKVICEHGEAQAVLKGRFYHRVEEWEALPAVGDFALLDYNPLGDSGIAGLLPRRSKFFRTDFSGHQAAYVKNIQEQAYKNGYAKGFPDEKAKSERPRPRLPSTP